MQCRLDDFKHIIVLDLLFDIKVNELQVCIFYRNFSLKLTGWDLKILFDKLIRIQSKIFSLKFSLKLLTKYCIYRFLQDMNTKTKNTLDTITLFASDSAEVERCRLTSLQYLDQIGVFRQFVFHLERIKIKKKIFMSLAFMSVKKLSIEFNAQDDNVNHALIILTEFKVPDLSMIIFGAEETRDILALFCLRTFNERNKISVFFNVKNLTPVGFKVILKSTSRTGIYSSGLERESKLFLRQHGYI